MHDYTIAFGVCIQLTVRSLLRQGGPAAVAALGLAFGARSALLKHEVAYVLGQMQDPDASDVLRYVGNSVSLSQFRLNLSLLSEIQRNLSMQNFGSVSGLWLCGQLPPRLPLPVRWSH